MARLLGPDEASRSVYTLVGGTYRSAAGLTATVYTDAALTMLANILTQGGAAIPGSALTVDAYSRLPIFQLPDGVDVVYATINGGPAVTLLAGSRHRSLASNLTTGYTAVSNTTSDTTVASLDIPAGAVAAGDVMVFESGGALLNNSGGSINHTFRLKVGATTVLSTSAIAISSNAADREWHLRAIIAFPTTSSQKVQALLTYALPDTANWGGGGGGGTAPGYGTAAEATTGAVTVAFSVQPGTASAAQSMQANWATLTRS